MKCHENHDDIPDRALSTGMSSLSIGCGMRGAQKLGGDGDGGDDRDVRVRGIYGEGVLEEGVPD